MLFILVAALTWCGTMSAQDKKHEVAISVGAGTTSNLLSGMKNLTGIMLEGTVTTLFSGGALTGYTTYDNKSEIIPISVEYFYHLSPVVGVGGILAFNHEKQDMYGNVKRGESTSKELIGEAKMTNFTVMPAVKLDWLRSKYFGMYSKFAIGVTFRSEKQEMNDNKELCNKTHTHFNWQASLLGMEAGPQTIRAFAELGFGEQGIGVLGLRCRF